MRVKDGRGKGRIAEEKGKKATNETSEKGRKKLTGVGRGAKWRSDFSGLHALLDLSSF